MEKVKIFLKNNLGSQKSCDIVKVFAVVKNI